MKKLSTILLTLFMMFAMVGCSVDKAVVIGEDEKEYTGGESASLLYKYQLTKGKLQVVATPQAGKQVTLTFPKGLGSHSGSNLRKAHRGNSDAPFGVLR